jgi:hypothetical protein
MDSELFTSVLALLTAAWTAWQEYRNRKDKKASKRPSDLLQAKPTKGAK